MDVKAKNNNLLVQKKAEQTYFIKQRTNEEDGGRI